MRSLTLVVFLFVLIAMLAFGQTDRGTITGTIADPVGAVVANAKVEARNVETGAVYEVGSSATGNYTLPQLPAGNYELSVTVPGFKKFIRQNIAVQVAGTLRIDATLEVGSASESVTVTEAAPLLKTESGELSHNVSTDRLNYLPAITLGAAGSVGNIRNPLQVVTLLPGTAFQSDSTLRVNGLPSSTQSIRIEGQDATNGLRRSDTQVNQAGLDAIQEVSVQTSNYAAEYGQAGGGYFNYTMKSGTNQLHGSAYDYFVNEALNAGTPFTAGNGAKSNQHLRNVQRRNDYGFTVGGPISIPKLYNGRDKSFFFFNFEQFRENQTVTTGLATVPTEAYRRGDFSGAQLGRLTIGGQPASDALGRALFQNGIYDPATQRFAPDGSVIRDQFPNNTIPITSLDPVAVKIQSFIPTPQGALASQAINNYSIPAYTNFRHTTIPSFKLDHNVSAAIKISGYYSANKTLSPRADGFQDLPITMAIKQDTMSHTIRVNYDHTITPTVLLHFGIGLLHTNQVNLTPPFDQNTLGWEKNWATPTLFPYMVANLDPSRGGFSYRMGETFNYAYNKDIKPTANTSLSMVRGNHTIKMGGEMILDGLPVSALSRTNGTYTFTAQQSSNPWEQARGLNAATGFSYASFLLGRNSGGAHAAPANGRLGSHAFGFYVQDTWKVTRKLTLDYGLRYDYVSLYKEQYGRMQSAALNLPNPAAGNRLGTVIYEATCNCSFNKNYPFAFGPRLGVAYQINSKTVLRAGAAVAYGTAPTNAGLSQSIGDYYNISSPGYGEASNILRDGNPYAPGNRFGNAPIFWPDFRPNYPAESVPGVRPPASPFLYIDRNSGRPPRIFQWSIGLQREITRNLVVEAAYVANRGVWWTAPTLQTESYNALTDADLQRYGINTNLAADRTLLTTPINSPTVLARFPYLANPDSVYPGFPRASNLNQALRPYPHWNTLNGFLGPPLGATWYDSLQAKVTKRLSSGLTVNSAFTWQKELALGVNADTSYLTPAPSLVSDVFNRNLNKQLSAFSRPFMLVVSFNYTTPGFAADGMMSKALSWAVRDWALGGVLNYQSGQVIRSPSSNNGYLAQTLRNAFGVFGGGATFQNRVAGQNPLLFDPNCKCFDPTTQLVLNPAAWSDAPAGQYGTAAAYYNNVRWQRQPSEALSLGRNFVMNRERNINLQIRMEFQNTLNRLYLANPAPINGNATFNPGSPNPQLPAVRNSLNALSSGFGFVNTFNGGAAQPRSGQIVARFIF